VAVYAVSLLCCGVGWTILQKTIEQTNDWSPAIKKVMDRQTKKGWISVATYGLGVPFAFINPFISEFLFVFTAVMWLVPDKNIEKAFVREEKD
jgi:hypothetical protein